MSQELYEECSSGAGASSSAPAIHPPRLPPHIELPQGLPYAVQPQATTAPVTQSGRPSRSMRLPKRFRDAAPDEMVDAAILSLPKRVFLIVRDTIRSSANRFGIWRLYPDRPSFDPDAFLSAEDVSNRHTSDVNLVSISPTPSRPPAPWPFSSMTVYNLINWAFTGSSRKSSGELNKLVKIIASDDFTPNDLKGVDIASEIRCFDEAEQKLQQQQYQDGFSTATVHIDVPSGQAGVPPKSVAVEGLHYRSIMSVIHAAFQDPISLRYHLFPFQEFHNIAPSTGGTEIPEHSSPASERSQVPDPTTTGGSPPAETSEHIYSELYNSDVWIYEHKAIQRAQLPPGEVCKLERVIIALMFWSDATHLANFGTAKIWPIYMMLGNLSKYVSSLPTSGACHHIAYIPFVRVCL